MQLLCHTSPINLIHNLTLAQEVIQSKRQGALGETHPGLP
jgi:hypothetical protein